MSTQILWTHGNAMVVEDPGEYSSIRHRGWGTELTYNSPSVDDDWPERACHIPLPSPPIADGVAPILVKLFILFETSNNLIIGRLDLWDANNLVRSFGHHAEFEPAAGLWIGTGSHLTLDRNNQLPLPEPHKLSAGPSLSFVTSLLAAPSLQLNVAAVGAEYVIDCSHFVPPHPRSR